MNFFRNNKRNNNRGSRKALFIFIETQEKKKMHNSVSISPTGKGGFGFLTPEQGQAAKAVFGKIILTSLRYFPEKPCTV